MIGFLLSSRDVWPDGIPFFWHTHVLLVGIPTTTFVHSVLFSFSLTLSRARGSGAASLLPGPNLYLRRNYAFHFH